MKRSRINKKRSFRESGYDYQGVEVRRGEEWEAFEDALEVFGADTLVQEIVRALDTNELREVLSFIFRMHDYESPYLKDFDYNDDTFFESRRKIGNFSRGKSIGSVMKKYGRGMR